MRPTVPQVRVTARNMALASGLRITLDLGKFLPTFLALWRDCYLFGRFV
jgi:hypothetical protein